MARTSTVPEVMTALRNSLKARLGEVKVFSAPAGDDRVPECVQLFRVEATHDFAAIGNRSRDEDYTIFGGIWITKPGAGEDKAVEARDRAYRLLADVEDILVEDPKLGNRVLWLLFRSGNLVQRIGDGNRQADLDFEISVRARLTRE